MIPGEVLSTNEPVTINAGAEQRTIAVTNTGSVPVHITAHYHVFEANSRLRFNRLRAWGMRPDVPATGAIRVEPGATVDVPLVPIAGNRIVRGFNGAVNGPLDDADVEVALHRLMEKGFLHQDDNDLRPG